jgi:hypothetical protein
MNPLGETTRLLGSRQYKSTRGRQGSSLGSNKATLLGENKGKPAGGGPINPPKIPLGEINAPLGKIIQVTLLGIRLIQTSDTINSALGNNCYFAGDDPHNTSKNNSAGDAGIDLLLKPVQSTGGMNSAGEIFRETRSTRGSRSRQRANRKEHHGYRVVGMKRVTDQSVNWFECHKCIDLIVRNFFGLYTGKVGLSAKA